MAYKRKRSNSAPGSSKRGRFMPRRRRVYRRKRVYYPRRRQPRSARKEFKNKIVKIPKLWPPNALATFEWRKADVMTTGTGGTLDRESFHMNCLYQIYDSSSPYPAGFTSLVDSVYRKYVVYAVDVEVVVHNESAASEVQILFHASPNVTSFGALTPQQVFALGRNQYTTVWQLENETVGGSYNNKKFKANYKLANLFGVSKGDIYDEPFMCTGPTGLPAREAFFLLGAASKPQATTAAVTIDYEIYIRYYCKLSANANDTF